MSIHNRQNPQDEVRLLTPEELEAVKEGLENGTLKLIPIDHPDDPDPTTPSPPSITNNV